MISTRQTMQNRHGIWASIFPESLRQGLAWVTVLCRLRGASCMPLRARVTACDASRCLSVRHAAPHGSLLAGTGHLLHPSGSTLHGQAQPSRQTQQYGNWSLYVAIDVDRPADLSSSYGELRQAFLESQEQVVFTRCTPAFACSTVCAISCWMIITFS